jgi:hypothetical protein
MGMKQKQFLLKKNPKWQIKKKKKVFQNQQISIFFQQNCRDYWSLGK